MQQSARLTALTLFTVNRSTFDATVVHVMKIGGTPHNVFRRFFDLLSGSQYSEHMHPLGAASGDVCWMLTNTDTMIVYVLDSADTDRHERIAKKVYSECRSCTKY